MSRVDIPNEDALYLQWVENFADVAVANATELGLTAGQTANLTALATAFANAYAASQAGKITAKGLVGTKDTMRTASEAGFRSIAKVINADSNIPVALKNDLGINITPSTSGPVVIPTDLVVTTSEPGTNTLRWSSNGNAKGTTYLIERRAGDTGPWIMITACTKLTYKQMGQTPGDLVWYRVSAKRKDVQSGPSIPAAAYPPEGTLLLLQEAA